MILITVFLLLVVESHCKAHGVSHTEDFCVSAKGTKVGGQCLVFEKELKDWKDSVESCESKGQQLVKLTDPIAFSSFMKKNYAGQHFWLGGSDIEKEGHFVWLDGSPLICFPWGKDQPNNYKGTQHCLSWGWKNSYQDFSCNQKYRYICEIEDPCVSAKGRKVGGQCLFFEKEPKDWIDSVKACESKGQQLVKLTDPSSFNSFMKKIYAGQNFWLGGSDIEKEGYFEWIDGSPFVNFPWGNKPDNALGKQHCLTWGWKNSFDDRDCDVKSRYICELQGYTSHAPSHAADDADGSEEYNTGAYVGDRGGNSRASAIAGDDAEEDPEDYMTRAYAGDEGGNSRASAFAGDDAEEDPEDYMTRVYAGDEGGNSTGGAYAGDDGVDEAAADAGVGIAGGSDVIANPGTGSISMDEALGNIGFTSNEIAVNDVGYSIEGTIAQDDEVSADEGIYIAEAPAKLHEVSIGGYGGIAKASSTHHSGNYKPIKAFGGSGFWHSGTPYTVPQILWVEFPRSSSIRVVEYSFTSRTDVKEARDGPSKYIFWASNHDDCTNEEEWVILKTDTSGTPFTSCNIPKMAVIENRYSYRCYGFKVLDVPGRDGHKHVTMANVHFYAISGDEGRNSKESTIAGDDAEDDAGDEGGSSKESAIAGDDAEDDAGDEGGNSNESAIAGDDAEEDARDTEYHNTRAYAEDEGGSGAIAISGTGSISMDEALGDTADCRSIGGVDVAGQCLTFNTDLKTWDEAVGYCAAKNQRLASLQDPNAVNAYLQKHHAGKKFWLGGSDKSSEGTWIWLDGRSFDGFPWPAGEPNNAYGNEDCLGWGWNNNYDDQTCTDPQGYICEPNPDCPTLGGVNVAGQCLSFNTDLKTWDQAVSSCTDKNQQLASLRDPAAVHDYLRRHHGSEKFWLGGSDKAHEGTWIWLDGRSFVGFPWPAGEPNHANGNEDCLGWGWNNNYNKNTYNDQTCTDTLGYICEPKPDCPSLGGIHVAGQCLSFNTELKTWDQAVSSCTDKNQRLASLRDPAAVHDYLRRHHGGKRFWLGGSDKTAEGTWTWLDGTSFFGFPWPAGKPNSQNSNEDCLEWGWNNNYNDQTCTDTFGYICEGTYLLE